jgi:23S rRNA pseudouridine1911/1915/1917 synthase
MEIKILHARESDKGKRLDVYLAEALKEGLSRSHIKKLIDKGHVTIGDVVKKAHYLLKGTEEIKVRIPESGNKNIKPEKIDIEIIYEDEDIIVVNKPSGMVVHPADGNPSHTLVNALLYHTKSNLAQVSTSPRPGIVHRLDKEVSGLLVAAKTDLAYNALIRGFKNKTIKRKYTAFVKGIINQNTGIADLPIGRSKRDRKKMAVRFLNSKEAVTEFKVLKRFNDHTKLELRLQTGRTHQIRVHMSYMGHPIIGDTKYGGGVYSRIALYAAELHLLHPRTKKPLIFNIDMPEELKKLDTLKAL